MNTLKDEVTALLDGGTSLADILDLVRGIKEEYDVVSDGAIIDDIMNVFDSYGRSVERSAVKEFVASTKGVVNNTKEKCTCTDTCSNSEKIAGKKPMVNTASKDLPGGGKVTVKTINIDAAKILDEWLKELDK